MCVCVLELSIDRALSTLALWSVDDVVFGKGWWFLKKDLMVFKFRGFWCAIIGVFDIKLF